MIAANPPLGQPHQGRRLSPALTEQAWLDWDVVDFNYQIDAFKSNATLPTSFASWHLPSSSPLGGPLPLPIETDAGDEGSPR